MLVHWYKILLSYICYTDAKDLKDGQLAPKPSAKRGAPDRWNKIAPKIFCTKIDHIQFYFVIALKSNIYFYCTEDNHQVLSDKDPVKSLENLSWEFSDWLHDLPTFSGL